MIYSLVENSLVIYEFDCDNLLSMLSLTELSLMIFLEDRLRFENSEVSFYYSDFVVRVLLGFFYYFFEVFEAGTSNLLNNCLRLFFYLFDCIICSMISRK